MLVDRRGERGERIKELVGKGSGLTRLDYCRIYGLVVLRGLVVWWVSMHCICFFIIR